MFIINDPTTGRYVVDDADHAADLLDDLIGDGGHAYVDRAERRPGREIATPAFPGFPPVTVRHAPDRYPTMPS